MNTLARRLSELGLSYKEYLASDHWKAVRARYYRTRSKECWVCGEKNGVDLHHMTYDRLGAEKLSDLAPLCREHHGEFHKKNPGLGDLRSRSKKFIRARSRQELPKNMKRALNGRIRLKTKNPRDGNGLIFTSLEKAEKTAARLTRFDHIAKAKTVSIDGPPCKRCNNPMVILKHPPNWKPTPGRMYYSFWYRCALKKCKTTLVMPPEAKVPASKGAR